MVVAMFAPALLAALWTPAPRAASPTRRGALRLASAAVLAPPIAASAAAPSFEAGTSAAFTAFAKGDYSLAEQLWSQAVEAYPQQPLAWANLATLLIINASDEMKLGEPPTGDALQRLERALVAIEKSEQLGSAPDALLLNTRGNALGLLQRWEAAQTAYTTSADAAARNFASIPRSNAALISFELRQDERAEREVRTLLRRDPQFVDGTALLAVLQWSRGDVGGAAVSYAALCEQPLFCERYASDAAVLGRWTPRAVEAFRSLLREPAVQRERKNAAVLAR